MSSNATDAALSAPPRPGTRLVRHRFRRTAKQLLGPGVSLVALTAVVLWALDQKPPTIPTSAESLALLGLAIGLYGFASIGRGLRWHRVLRRADVEHERNDAYALVAVGYMGNTVLPARGGELLRMELLANRSSGGRRQVLGSILAERLVDATALILLFASLTWLGVAGAPAGEEPAALALGAVALVGVGVPVYLHLRARGKMQRFADLVRPFSRPSRLLLGRFGLGMLALTLGVWLCEGLICFLIAVALELDLQPIESVFIIVLASFFAMIPSAPGFVGTFDAAVIFGLEAVGVSGGDAITAAILLRFILFVPITVAGLALLMTRYGGLGTLRRVGART